MTDHYQEWYESQVLKGRDMSGVLPPHGTGGHRVARNLGGRSVDGRGSAGDLVDDGPERGQE